MCCQKMNDPIRARNWRVKELYQYQHSRLLVEIAKVRGTARCGRAERGSVVVTNLGDGPRGL